MFQTGANEWVRTTLAAEADVTTRKLYFHRGRQARVRRRRRTTTASLRRVRLRPGESGSVSSAAGHADLPGPGWRSWMVEDQRFVDDRPDVLT